MITVTESALRLLETYKARAPDIDWCVLIAWKSGSADNYRLPNGQQAWLRTIPEGWVVALLPSIALPRQSAVLSEVSGVKVFLDPRAPSSFPFGGGAITASGHELVIAP